MAITIIYNMLCIPKVVFTKQIWTKNETLIFFKIVFFCIHYTYFSKYFYWLKHLQNFSYDIEWNNVTGFLLMPFTSSNLNLEMNFQFRKEKVTLDMVSMETGELVESCVLKKCSSKSNESQFIIFFSSDLSRYHPFIIKVVQWCTHPHIILLSYKLLSYIHIKTSSLYYIKLFYDAQI